MNASGPNALARALRGFFADHLPRVAGAVHTPSSVIATASCSSSASWPTREASRERVRSGDLGPRRVSTSSSIWRLTATTWSRRAMSGWRPFTRSFGIARRRSPLPSSTVNASSPSRSSAAARARRVPRLPRNPGRPGRSGSEHGRRTTRLCPVGYDVQYGRAGPGDRHALRGRPPVDPPASSPVRQRSKGRICPLWTQTANLLRALLAERGRDRRPRSDLPQSPRRTDHAIRRALPAAEILHACERQGHRRCEPSDSTRTACGTYGGPPAPRWRRYHHDQSLARPRQCDDHQSLRDRRSRHETESDRAGPPHRLRIRPSVVADRCIGAGVAGSSERTA